jgi:hypothetical protein
MEIREYFDKLLDVYKSSFDLTVPYNIGGIEYLGYGHLYSNSTKYVLVKSAKLWSANAFEHLIFMESHGDLKEKIDEAKFLISEYMEENFVRKGEKYPVPDHMYSFLTVVVLTNDKIDSNIKEEVRRYKFTKNYLFTIRGYSEGRLVLVNVKEEEIILSKSAQKLEEFFRDSF